jgi:pimeloyl-CoA synthetase
MTKFRANVRIGKVHNSIQSILICKVHTFICKNVSKPRFESEKLRQKRQLKTHVVFAMKQSVRPMSRSRFGKREIDAVK